MSRALWTAAALASALVVLTLTGTTLQAPGIEIDAFAALVLLLATTTGALAVSFARRALRDEPYHRRFERASVALVASAAAFAATTDLLVLAAAWIAIGIAAVVLIGTGPTAGRDQRIRRARVAMVGSDVAFALAIAILVVASGSTAIADVGTVDGVAAVAAGLAVVIAAIARAATMPVHRWLADSLAAPTPSSALLHAGVVNGGAIAAITLAPVVSGTAAPALVAVLVGTASCVLAEAIMLTRPDVKGRLAWSTTAQMSFTLVLVGLGLHTAAAVHLVAHGLFKAALFLGSGAAVRAGVRAARMQPMAMGRGAGIVAAIVAGTVAVVTVTAVDPSPSADLAVPTLLAAVAAAAAGQAALSRLSSRRLQVGALLATSALLVGFVTVAATLKDRVAPAIASEAALPAALVLVVLAALAVVTATHRTRPAPGGAVDRAWSAARRMGAPTPRPVPPTAVAEPRPTLEPAPALLPRG